MALTAALARSHAVSAGGSCFPQHPAALGRQRHIVRYPEADRFLLPLQRFAEVAAIGVVNVASDERDAARVPMIFTDGSRIEPSFPLRGRRSRTGSSRRSERDGLTLGGRFVATDLGHACRSPSTVRAAASGQCSPLPCSTARVAPEALAGKVVVIGATVTGGGDVSPRLSTGAARRRGDGDGDRQSDDGRRHGARPPGAARRRGIAIVLAMLVVGLMAWRRSVAALSRDRAVVLAWAAINVTPSPRASG